MPAQFKVPTGPALNSITIDFFKGVDLYNAAANVSTARSPEAPNMIRDEVGKVRKRMGFQTVHTFPARVNGSYAFQNDRLVHAGTTLYRRSGSPSEEEAWTAVYTDMADRRSTGFHFGGKFYLLDGKRFLCWDGTEVKAVDETAYIPTVIISRNPSGGGKTYEPLNLCGKRWKEAFLGTATATVYQLTAEGLDSSPVKARVLQSGGTWKELTEGTGFTVNRTTGAVTFSSPPGKSPVDGVDNVEIEASKDREGYTEKINGCDTAVLFGVNGAPDRVFVTGNASFPNLDFYSGYNEPAFFGDTWYSTLGQDDTEIMGYSVVGNYLAAHKSNSTDGRNIILRAGLLDSAGNASFPIVNTLKGEGAVGRRGFASLGAEPVFLTRRGVYAITTAELTGERYSQSRSLYISSALEKENLKDAYAFVWNDFCLIGVSGGRVYLLDSLQKEYARDEPYSSYQYECYYLTGVDARVLWEEDGALWFGSSSGALCRFHNNVDDPKSYNDDGKPIRAYWDTPDLSGKRFYENKTFRYLAVKLAAAVVTGVRVWAQVRGLWSQVFDAGERARFFDWEYLNFAKFVFSADRTPRTVGGKIKIKKVDKARFRLLNEELDEPFGIYAFALEFTEPGSRFKG